LELEGLAGSLYIKAESDKEKPKYGTLWSFQQKGFFLRSIHQQKLGHLFITVKEPHSMS